MSKKKDLISLGEAYADVFNKVVVSENVPVGEIGNADLVTKDTGPTERGGFRPAKIDIDRMSEKDKKDNIYNIKGYTYGDGNDPGDTDQPDPTGPTYAQVAYTGNVGPEEDEEETEKEKSYKKRWGKDLDKQREREGSSNAGDYSDVDKDDFCGPAGGAAPGTYPVDTEKRARAALSYAHNAPDPEGIKRCVYRKAKKHGWFEEPEDEENPDAHTYSNLGREPGPAAELNPNIGFDEDEEAVNENLLDKIQDGLTYVGLAPGVGVPVDLANAGISALRGKWGDAALNVGAAVPLAGWAVPGKKIGDKIVDAAKGTHMAGRSKKAKAAAFGGEVGKDLFTPEQSFMDPGIQLRDLNPANWSQPKTGAPSRAAILQGKGPKPTKQQLHAKGIPTMSPVSDEEVSVGAEVMFDGMMKSGQVEEVDLENGVAVVVDEDGGEHIVDLDNFDVVLNP